MTRKKAGLSILYVAVFLQLAIYLARDFGQLSEGRLYSSLPLLLGAIAFAAAVWIYREGRSG
jgi:hypothetical protein